MVTLASASLEVLTDWSASLSVVTLPSASLEVTMEPLLIMSSSTAPTAILPLVMQPSRILGPVTQASLRSAVFTIGTFEPIFGSSLNVGIFNFFWFG